MAPENVMMLMKQYLSTMSKRIDELVAKTRELEAELRKQSESQVNGLDGMSERLQKLSSDQEDIQALLEKARDEWKKRSEELEANLDGFANFEAVSELQNKFDKDIETLRDEKLDRGDFQEFVDSTFTPLKELFQENEPSSSFADFASSQTEAPRQEPIHEQPSEDIGEAIPSQSPPSSIPPPPPDQRRVDKKRKKWL